MATIKVFALGGLDKKSNDLTRSPEKASDMLNMEYDVQSSLKKRNGFELFSNQSAKDMIYYSKNNEFLLFSESTNVVVLKSDGTPKSYNGNNYLPLPSGIPQLSNVSISYCENSNNIYFTNTDYTTYVMKYDGGFIYRAGLPAPRKSGVNLIDQFPTFSATTTGYSRIFYSYKDLNGNVTYSPYIQLSVKPSSATITVSSFKTDSAVKENGFYDKYCYIAKTGHSDITSSARTLTCTKHNYVPGDKFLIDTENKLISISSAKSFLILDVESVTPTTIKFTTTSIGSYTISFANGSSYYSTEYPVDIRCQLMIAYSTSPDTGYTVQNFKVLDNSSVLNTIDTVLSAEGVLIGQAGGPTFFNFEDIYDSTTLKIMPPICKYIASFGNQIAYCSVLSTFTVSGDQISAPNEKINYNNDDFIVYSDTSTGDNQENTSPLNTQKIGETWDGSITGVKRCNDSLVVFKNRGVFSIDGVLISGEYQLRKINTNFVGCTSHKSILESDDGLYFQGHNGLYYTNAIGVKKLTYEIDSVINSEDYNTTRSVRLKKKQKALFYVPQLSKIIVLDYYYNQIYFWDSIDASKGFVEDSSGDVYFSNGTNIYKFNNGYLDDTQPINAYYSTTWHHAGEPSLNKKWLSMRVFALTDDAFTATIKTEGNWDTAQLTTNTMQFSSSDQTKFLMLDMQTKRSLRITFSNNVKKETSPGSNIFIGENLAITGYELTFEKFNDVDKN